MNMKKILSFLSFKLYSFLQSHARYYVKSKLGACGNGSYIRCPFSCSHPENIFMADNSHIFENFNYIGNSGKFLMGENSGAAIGLTVVTNIHKRSVGHFRVNYYEDDYDEDIIVDEDVLIGANVTLMDGCHIGRGATIGAGAVVRNDVPPYAIVVGNPAKVIAFSFTPDEVEEHEAALYPEGQRIDIDKYEEDYHKYFISRIKDIQNYMK